MKKTLRSVNIAFWDDPYIEELDRDEKLLFLYLLTNSNTNMLGVYEITIKKIIYDTSIDKKNIYLILEKFANDKKIFYINNYIILRNFIENQTYNPKMIIGAFNIFSKLPDTLLKYIIGYHTLCIPYYTLFSQNINIINKFNSLCISYDSLYKPYNNIILIKDEYKMNENTILIGTLKEFLNEKQRKEYTESVKIKFLDKTENHYKNIQKAINKTDEKCSDILNKFINECIVKQKQYLGIQGLSEYFINWHKYNQ